MFIRTTQTGTAPDGSPRLKRSGQGVLIFRARLTSGRFDSVWAQRTHRRCHAHAQLWANANRTPLAQGALDRWMQTIRNQAWFKPSQRGITPGGVKGLDRRCVCSILSASRTKTAFFQERIYDLPETEGSCHSVFNWKPNCGQWVYP